MSADETFNTASACVLIFIVALAMHANGALPTFDFSRVVPACVRTWWARRRRLRMSRRVDRAVRRSPGRLP